MLGMPRGRTTAMLTFLEGRMCQLLSRISIMEHSQLRIFMVSMLEFNQLREAIIRKCSAIRQIRYRATNTAKICPMLRPILQAKVLLEIEMDTFYLVPYKMAEALISPHPVEAEVKRSRNARIVSPQVIPSSQPLLATVLLSEVVLP
jgi:hypothetical protein